MINNQVIRLSYEIESICKARKRLLFIIYLFAFILYNIIIIIHGYYDGETDRLTIKGSLYLTILCIFIFITHRLIYTSSANYMYKKLKHKIDQLQASLGFKKVISDSEIFFVTENHAIYDDLRIDMTNFDRHRFEQEISEKIDSV